MRVAEGANFTIDLDEGIATLRVWKRPDLSFDEGARLASTILDNIRSLATGASANAFVMDLREAPVLTGKRTRATLVDIVGACEGAKKRIAVLFAAGVQRATLEKTLAAAGAELARFVTDPEAARAWARGDGE